MRRQCKDGLEWFTFDLLSDIPGLFHAVIAKINLALHTHPEIVKENFESVKSILGLPKIISSHQIHEDKQMVVKKTTSERLYGFDALMTQEKGLALLTSHADCQSALFFDPMQRALANVHCGWRGSVRNIYQKTIAAMGHHFGSKPEDLLVCIGPSLGPAHAEFVHFKQELPPAFWNHQVKENHFDFWAISEEQCLAAGILAHHLEIARLCSFENSDAFFSYRRQKKEGQLGPLLSGNGSLGLIRE